MGVGQAPCAGDVAGQIGSLRVWRIGSPIAVSNPAQFVHSPITACPSFASLAAVRASSTPGPSETSSISSAIFPLSSTETPRSLGLVAALVSWKSLLHD